MKKKIVSMLIATMLVATSIVGCGSTEDTDSKSSTASSETTTEAATESGNELTTVKVLGEFDPQISGQQIIAKELGYFEEEGLNVDLELLTDPSISTTMIASGDAQFYSASQYQNIILTDQGTEVCVIAPVVDAGNTQVVVGGPNLEVNSAKDLEGKKMGYTDGAGVIIAVKNMCDELGVDFDSFELVNLQASDMLASLQSGDIDFFAAWEPWGLKAEEFGGKTLFTGTKSYLPENTGDVDYLNFIVCINVSKEYAESNPEVCSAYIKAMIKATDYINANLEEAASIVAGKINLDPEECYKIMQKNVYDVAFSETYNKSCESIAAYMQESGMTSTLINCDVFNNTSLLSAIDPNKVK